MNPQLELEIPIPIMEEIIYLSTLLDKLNFRLTCKLFLLSTNKKFFPTITTTLYGNTCESEDSSNVKFCNPFFGVLDSSSNILYVSDRGNNVIKKIDLSTNRVTTLCGIPTKRGWKDGIGSDAQFNSPSGLALNEKEKLLYVSDSRNCVIRKINLMDESVVTIVGQKETCGREDGIGKEATFRAPCGLALDSVSNHLYVADVNNHSIRKIILNESRVETLCGNGKWGYIDGSFEESMFDHPYDIALNFETKELYISDFGSHSIRVISLENRTVKTLCGTPGLEGHQNGDRAQAKFDWPKGLGLDIHSQCLYVSDDKHVIRKIFLSRGVMVATLCGQVGKKGTRDGILPLFDTPSGIVVNPYSQSLYIMDFQNHTVREVIDKNRIPAKNINLHSQKVL